MKFAIKTQQQIQLEQWNTFVRNNSMGYAYFLYEMIGIDRWSSYQNLSFAIVDEDNNDEILMIHQLHKTNYMPVLAKLHLYQEKLKSRWGYILKDGLSKKQVRKIKEFYENYIDSLMDKYNISSFSISLPPLTKANIENNLVNPLIHFNFSPKIRYTYCIDLSKADERMLADCEETTRQAIRKTEASNKYEIREAQSNEEDCKIFIDLHKETYTRTNAKNAIISDDYHRNMFFNLLPKGICRVFFLINKENNEVVATVAILIYNSTAYYWWGDSKNEKEIGINKYLLFKVICIIREQFERTGIFETGGAYVHLRTGKYKGLNDFKKCFGTYLYPIFGGDYSKKSSKPGIKTKLKRLVKKLLHK